MAKHLVKCFYCGETFDINACAYIKPRSNRYAHASCAANAETAKTKQERDKLELIDYIKKLFNYEVLPTRVQKQISDYVENKGYSYSGIKKTLIYFFEIKGNDLEKAHGGIGIVPFIYQEAERYYRTLWETKEKNKQLSLVTKTVTRTVEIHIPPPVREPMKHTKRMFSFLEGEEDE